MLFWKKIVGSKDRGDACQMHNSAATLVCSNKSCREDRFICSSTQCSSRHSSHSADLLPAKEFAARLHNFLNQISHRDQIARSVDSYMASVAEHVLQICQKQKETLLKRLDLKFFPRRFAHVQQLYQKNFDFVPELCELPFSDTKSLPLMVEAKIKEYQKTMRNNITAEALGVSATLLDPPDKPLSTIEQRQQAVIDLMPFRCKLALRFQASIHGFLTKNLYTLGISGPILVLVRSKKKTFGGFSPNMFTAKEEYIEDKKAESFLFSVDQRQILPIRPQYKKYAIKGGRHWGFGRGDLTISEQCHKGNMSWAEIGNVYSKPRRSVSNQKEWLGGSWYFRVLEYQIYQVNILGKKL